MTRERWQDMVSRLLCAGRDRGDSRTCPEGYTRIRQHIKQGTEFSREIASILTDYAAQEEQHAQSIGKLSNRINRAVRLSHGEELRSWSRTAETLQLVADSHTSFAKTLSSNVLQPLHSFNNLHYQKRKKVEHSVEKAEREMISKCAQNCRVRVQLEQYTRQAEDITAQIEAAKSQDTKKQEKYLTKMLEGRERKDQEYMATFRSQVAATLDKHFCISDGFDRFEAMEEERLRMLNVYRTFFERASREFAQDVARIAPSDKEINQCNVEIDMRPIYSICDQPTTTILSFDLLTYAVSDLSQQFAPTRRGDLLRRLDERFKNQLHQDQLNHFQTERLAKQIVDAETEQVKLLERDSYKLAMTATLLSLSQYLVQSALARLGTMKAKETDPLARFLITRGDAIVLELPVNVAEENGLLPPKHSPHSAITDAPNSTGLETEPSVSSESSASLSSIHVAVEHHTPVELKDTQRHDNSEPQSPLCDAETLDVDEMEVLYNYTPTVPGELKLVVGETITVLKRNPDGWWLGECGDDRGIFPSNYVHVKSRPVYSRDSAGDGASDHDSISPTTAKHGTLV